MAAGAAAVTVWGAKVVVATAATAATATAATAANCKGRSGEHSKKMEWPNRTKKRRRNSNRQTCQMQSSGPG